MICKHCGKELNDDFKICPYCGQVTEKAKEENDISSDIKENTDKEDLNKLEGTTNSSEELNDDKSLESTSINSIISDKLNKKTIIIVVATILVVIIAIVIIVGNSNIRNDVSKDDTSSLFEGNISEDNSDDFGNNEEITAIETEEANIEYVYDEVLVDHKCADGLKVSIDNIQITYDVVYAYIYVDFKIEGAGGELSSYDSPYDEFFATVYFYDDNGNILGSQLLSQDNIPTYSIGETFRCSCFINAYTFNSTSKIEIVGGA